KKLTSLLKLTQNSQVTQIAKIMKKHAYLCVNLFPKIKMAKSGGSPRFFSRLWTHEVEFRCRETHGMTLF
ncbi:hypothetical protein KKD61_00895, partial [Patescibacteria group bacterium]|nr:hypothetical protein [Patescibacteria group bacterium]